MSKKLRLLTICAAGLLFLAACSPATTETKKTEAPVASATAAATETEAPAAPATVTIKDIHGEVTVKTNPKTVVALDNRTFLTLSDWGVKLAAAPKAVMYPKNPYVADESVQNIGNHREPNLELLAATNPDLVIVGQRFAKYYKQIKELVPNAEVIDLSWDVSGKSGNAGESLVNGLIESTIGLGKIFDKNDEAKKLVDDFTQAIADAKAGYEKVAAAGKADVMSVVVSGGEIGFSAPHTGRVWGPMYDIFGWKPALEVDNTSSDHKGDKVSVEAIAQSNPDWIFVMDRDAAISKKKEGTAPAKDVIEGSEALKNTKAIVEGHVVYAPGDTYTNESIQTYITVFRDMAEAFSK